jgi:hypothetical protein
MKNLFWSKFTAKVLMGITVVSGLISSAVIVQAQNFDREELLRAELVSFNQVPSVLTKSKGSFLARINEDGTIVFALSYANMTSPVVQAHIHFGASKTNGGVMVFLCGGAKPACPASGTTTGTITAADVSVLPATNGDSVIPQGIQPAILRAWWTPSAAATHVSMCTQPISPMARSADKSRFASY